MVHLAIDKIPVIISCYEFLSLCEYGLSYLPVCGVVMLMVRLINCVILIYIKVLVSELNFVSHLESAYYLIVICSVIQLPNINLLTEVTSVRLEPRILCLCCCSVSQLQYSLNHPNYMGGVVRITGESGSPTENPVV